MCGEEGMVGELQYINHLRKTPVFFHSFLSIACVITGLEDEGRRVMASHFFSIQFQFPNSAIFGFLLCRIRCEPLWFFWVAFIVLGRGELELCTESGFRGFGKLSDGWRRRVDMKINGIRTEIFI